MKPPTPLSDMMPQSSPPDNSQEDPQEEASESSQTEQYEHMCNVAQLGDGTFDQAKDGDQVEARVKGKVVVMDDGSQFLAIQSVNDVPVESLDVGGNDDPDAEMDKRFDDVMGRNEEASKFN